ncbi:hypothetical protein COMA1_11451 [Candidatus Nitrospira nitrosa]|uniref:Uncharacterized protein n=1 Tax=Candidatus Nitrospira nitrosa TaxID=1742972 RepID=A0A0S4LB27_9BACT|nr:hypothetical protein COMA1_11451 [Candidatus Nitrospira nitrosa]
MTWPTFYDFSTKSLIAGEKVIRFGNHSCFSEAVVFGAKGSYLASSSPVEQHR